MRPLLALFIRSLREDARSKVTYLMRAALVALILIALWITHMKARWAGAVGRDFFSAVLWIDLFALSIAGLGYFSSAITEEKDDGTLGLLRMTDLNALAILLGKSTARLVATALLLVAQIPFVLVAVTMGGVSTAQILAGYGCLLSFTFLLANIGLLTSVVFRRSRASAAAAGMVGAVFVFGSDWLGWVQAEWGRHWPWLAAEGVHDALRTWSSWTPIARLLRVLGTGFGGAPFDVQAVMSVLLGGGCFLAAWMLFEPCTRRALDANEGAGRSRLRRSKRAAGLSDGAVQAKEFRAAGGWRAVSIKLVLVVGLMVAWWRGFMSNGWNSGDAEQLGSAWFFSNAALLLLFLALDASRLFGLERQQKTLVSLCGLPLSAASLAWAKVRGCLAANWPPLVPMVAGIALVLPELLKGLRNNVHGDEFLYMAGGLTHAALSYALLPVFIAWLSLRFRRGAFTGGVTIWLVGNWVVAALCGVMFQNGSFVVLPLISGTLLITLTYSIPARLEALAAEE